MSSDFCYDSSARIYGLFRFHFIVNVKSNNKVIIVILRSLPVDIFILNFSQFSGKQFSPTPPYGVIQNSLRETVPNFVSRYSQ